MKLKNLFLASIAVAAMTACSNETEFLDNGNQTVSKDASMQFGIAFPQGALSRAGEEIGNDGKETGISSENAFTDITVVIDYENSNNRDVLTFQRKDFTEQNGENKQMLYLKNSIAVQAGKATISAFVNASDALKADLIGKTALNTLKVTKNYSSSIDDLTEKGGIAEADKFLMSGSKAGEKFEKGQENPVSVPVDRVAAKLVEKSKTAAFIIKKSSFEPTSGAEDLSITLQEYNFANLTQDTYTLKNTTPIESDWFNEYASAANTSWDAYMTPKTISGSTKPEETNNITYCTENLTSNTTLVLYKAVAKWGNNEAKTFFVDTDDKVYLSFSELAKVYNLDGFTENSSIADFAVKGIKKYEGGVCYYKSNKIGSITRNNVYYLNVLSIADLGDPTPGDTETPSTINLTVAVNPWTINLVDIEL